MNWIYTTNHKRIAINYFFFIIFSGSCGLILATLIRMELAYPGVSIFMGDGIKYLTISTLHGVIMVFFMIIPLIFGAYGNYLLPLQLGVHDVAFPRMNSAAFWFLPAGLIMLCQLLSLDKRYHTINCFSFTKVDSYINFNKLQNINTVTVAQPANLKLDQNYKYNYNIFNNHVSAESSFFLVYKYNIFEKNYNINYNFFAPYMLIYNYLQQLIYNIFYFFKNIDFFKKKINTNLYDIIYNYYYINIFNLTYNYKNWGLLYLKELIENNIAAFYMPANLYWCYCMQYKFINPTHSNVTFFNTPINYSIVQLLFNTKFTPQEYYDTQFILKQRHPLYINTKFISTSTTSTIFNVQLIQNMYNMYTKYYINIGGSGHLLYFINNKNVLLWSSYLKFFLKTLKFDVITDSSSEYIYKYNIKGYNNTVFNLFDKNVIYNSHLLDYPIWLNSVINLYNFNKVFSNQRYLAFTFKTSVININNYQQTFSNWKNLRFQREFWRCRSLISKNLLHNYKYHSDWSFLFDISNKYSVVSDSADVLPGWAFVTPFSARTKYTKSGKTDVALFAIAISSFGSFIGSLNFLITYRYLSTLNNKKMRDARCFFSEGLLVGSGMMVAANPVLFIAIFLLLSDRQWHTSFFDYSNGGDTVLFQHLFWFFGHPEVYIIIIPCFGLINTILSYYLRKRLSARASLLYSMYTIAFLSFFVWGHHMYMVGLSHHTRMLYSTITVMISVPAATKIMHWLVTIVNSSIHYELPLIFAVIFIFLFISGGISGMAVAHTGMDILFHDTFYVIGHFHVMFAGAAMFATFGAFYFYFPFIWGVKYNRIFAYFHLFYYLVGQLMTVIPMLWLGYAGMPRRILDYPAVFGGWHSVISSGHLISTAGIASFFLMLFLSLKQQQPAINNTLGVGRYNTRLNFYIYESNKLFWIRRKYKIFLQK